MILAIDPGPERSAWLEYIDGEPASFGIDDNSLVLALVGNSTAPILAVEMIASYGMPVGAEVFETCVWIGRFIERWHIAGGKRLRMPYRREVKAHLCHSAKATDANVRQALIDRFGPGKAAAVGLKASPGPLYGVKKDVWQALGVAVTVADNEDRPSEESLSVTAKSRRATSL